MYADQGAPYYLAKTSLGVSVLVDQLGSGSGSDPGCEFSRMSDPGASSVGWWTRHDSARILARPPLELPLHVVPEPPRYQQIAERAVWLRGFDYPDTLIAACIGVAPKTVAKAIRWFETRSPSP